MKCMRAITAWAAMLIAGTVAADSGSETLYFESAEQHVQLLELYTSEGCSSCPPADRWISELTENPDLWKSIVPVAFHVDYWDYLGWEDRFARADYSQRQRNWANENSVRTVYTPGFVVDGHEWRAWFSDRRLPETAARKTGKLRLAVNVSTVDVSYETSSETEPLFAHIALLGFGVETNVRAGENSGRVLSHNFVVLGMRTSALEKSKTVWRARLELPASDEKTTRRAVAAWVSGAKSQRALQAVGGWLTTTKNE